MKNLRKLTGITFFQICVNVIGLPVDLKHNHYEKHVELKESKSKFHK